MAPAHSCLTRWSVIALTFVCGIHVAIAQPEARQAKAGLGTLISVQEKSESVTAEIDRLLLQAAQKENITPATTTSDEEFLRRVYLDLIGTVPSVRDLTLFVLDPSSDKRRRMIDFLLNSPGYSETWAVYWSEVVYSRATDPRARALRGTFEDWLKSEFQKNRPWDEITTEILTATGKVQEHGQTALLFAHLGEPTEVAAEVSRIFLGIQIQCANCHDHPSDIWKREQFHQLAAYFPRIDVRRDPQAGFLDFEISSHDVGRNGRMDPDMVFKFVDKNHDGKITKEEAEKAPQLSKFFDRLLQNADTNHDGALTIEEMRTMPKPDGMGRGELEYVMPDLQNPKAKGKQLAPVFFVTGEQVQESATDQERRQTLAKQITASNDPWFAKAFVNRIWGELFGEGFYAAIDDLGPTRTAILPEVLDLLADGFRSHHYDVKWLFRTITNTQAYQHALRVRRPGEPQVFAAATPVHLRFDQVYHAITQVLEIKDLGGLPAPDRARPNVQNRTRLGFQELFGFDPSIPKDEILGNIPQALFLMNSPNLQQALKADRNSVLARILKENGDDTDAIREIYLRFLSREPNRQDLDLNLAYLKQVNKRNEAFEDIAWGLLNSSEFLTKR